MVIRAVIVDIGGVLSSEPPTGWGRDWELRLGLPRGGLRARVGHVMRSMGERDWPEARVRAAVAATLGLSPRQAHAYLEDMWVEYLGSPNREVMAWFRAQRHRYRTGILSNSGPGARERERARYDFEGICDVLVYSHEEGVSKPDPRSYRLVCGRLGVAFDQAVFLDNLEANVAAARALGMHAVHFRDTAQALAEVDAVLARHA